VVAADDELEAQIEARLEVVLTVLDGPAVRRWADAGLAGLVAAQGEIDRLNVYPVPDSDTGTNLVRTMRSAVDALTREPGQELEVVCECLAGAALRGACGNSGTILAQLLRGLADAAQGLDALDPAALAAALFSAAGLARAALAQPVEGTILSVADAVAEGALAAAAADLVAVTRAAERSGAAALAATPDQLAALGGRVDAGGRGLLVLVEALTTVVTGTDDPGATRTVAEPAVDDRPGVPERELDPGGPSHEVMYLLETSTDSSVAVLIGELRSALDRIGDSVLVVGGRGLWQVHAHVDDVGAAVEAGFAAGRPHQVRIVTFADQISAGHPVGRSPTGSRLAVVAVVEGSGIAELLTRAGASVLAGRVDAPALADAVAAAGSAVVAVLPGSPEALAVAQRLAAADGRVRVVRSRSAVQAIAALAVHDPDREPETDLLAMATAAAGCRDGLVEVAEGDGVTSAGVCRRGDVLGHVGGDVALIGSDVEQVSAGVLDLLLGGGGELVTLVAGRAAAPDLAERVAAALHARRPDVDITTYHGGQPTSYLLVGVE